MLSHNDNPHDFLPQVWLSLLDSGHNHVINAGRREPVQEPLDYLHGDYVEVLGISVISAVDSGCHQQTQRQSELVTSRTSAPCSSRTSIHKEDS